MVQANRNYDLNFAVVLPDANGGFTPYPDLLTEAELIRLLRISEISKAKNYRNVIASLKRFRGLPCIHVCRQPLYPRDAIMEWVKEQTK
jgi:hypothetical protein